MTETPTEGATVLTVVILVFCAWGTVAFLSLCSSEDFTLDRSGASQRALIKKVSPGSR